MHLQALSEKQHPGFTFYQVKNGNENAQKIVKTYPGELEGSSLARLGLKDASNSVVSVEVFLEEVFSEVTLKDVDVVAGAHVFLLYKWI